MSSFRELTVTAHTPAGFTAGDPWSPALDGLLSWTFMKRKLGPDFGTNLNLEPVVGLPLEVKTHGKEWWYSCGLPEFVPVKQWDKKIHRRFNDVDAERYLTGKNKIQTSMGEFKNMRKPKLMNVAGTVTWKAVGDMEAIKDLLSEIPAIGNGWSRGFGQVTKWTVEPGFQGKIRRWFPEIYARKQGWTGPSMNYGIRPPARLPECQAFCMLPDEKSMEAEDLMDFFEACDSLV